MTDFERNRVSMVTVWGVIVFAAVGGWTAAAYLGAIKQDVHDLGTKLDTHTAQILVVQNQVADVSLQEHDTKLTLADIQRRMAEREAIDRRNDQKGTP